MDAAINALNAEISGGGLRGGAEPPLEAIGVALLRLYIHGVAGFLPIAQGLQSSTEATAGAAMEVLACCQGRRAGPVARSSADQAFSQRRVRVQL